MTELGWLNKGEYVTRPETFADYLARVSREAFERKHGNGEETD